MTELAEGLAAAEEPAAENPAPGNPADAALALRLKAIERERVIVDYANRGVAMPEIAARVGMTERAARAPASRCPRPLDPRIPGRVRGAPDEPAERGAACRL